MSNIAKRKTWKFGLMITLLSGGILFLVPLALQWYSGDGSLVTNDGSLVTIKAAPYDTRPIFLSNSVLLTSGNRKIQLWNSQTGKLFSEKTVSFDVLEPSPDGQFCVGRGYNSSKVPVTAIWNLRSGLMLSQLISNKLTNGTSKFIDNPAISPNGKMVAGIERVTQQRIGGGSNTPPTGGICVRNTTTGKIIWSVEEFRSIHYGFWETQKLTVSVSAQANSSSLFRRTVNCWPKQQQSMTPIKLKFAYGMQQRGNCFAF
jgi:WD40 repeat protein